jgi:hypothetical protein
MLVPDVLATAVPDVITLDAIELTTAPVIVGLVKVLAISVCVAESSTTLPVTAGIVAVKLLAVFVGTSSMLPPLAAASLIPI